MEYKNSGSRHTDGGDKWAKNTGDQKAQKHGHSQSSGSSKNSKGKNQGGGVVLEKVHCTKYKIVNIRIIVVIFVVR